MQDEPSGLLSDLEVLGELGGSDALRVAGHHPDRHESLAKGQLCVLEDRADFDGKALAAIAALMGPVIAEMVNLCAAAVRAIGTVLPANRQKMVNTTCSSEKASIMLIRLSTCWIMVASSLNEDILTR